MLVYTKKCYKQKKCDEWLKIRDERSNCRSSLIFDHSSRKKEKKSDYMIYCKKNNKGGKYYVFQTQKINSENL